MQQPLPAIRTMTELDHVRLSNMIRRHPVNIPSQNAETLGSALDNADLVAPEQVSPGTVTMSSQVVIADARTGAQTTLTLCYPHDAAPAGGRISVMSPIGTSLIGLQVGDLASWCGPDGHASSARVVSIPFQPEANGDYLT